MKKEIIYKYSIRNDCLGCTCVRLYNIKQQCNDKFKTGVVQTVEAIKQNTFIG